MPRGPSKPNFRLSISRLNCVYLPSVSGHKMLDICLIWYIIIFTFRCRGAYAQRAQDRSQAESPSRAGVLEPAPSRRHRPTFPLHRLLRCPRSVAGQIRDAPARGERRPFSDTGLVSVRTFAPFVLSGANRFPPSRPSRSGPAKAWPTPGAQTHRRGPRVSQPGATAGPTPTGLGAGAPGTPALSVGGSPAQHRTRSGAQSKKTAITRIVDQTMAADLTAQYEQLRSNALLSPGIHRCGLGLVLFLRQGMLSWMRAASRCTGDRLPQPSPSPQAATLLPLEIRSQITVVLVAMIVGQQQEAFCER